ncbi:Thioredoxin reductase [Pseudomonas reinekei]|uniref:Flavoprotein n=1 Tax=Pseudomonas reinekei TaxID=395598 RepID=A0A1H0JGQ7_PSERE|nr:NAD(P)-binding domain-containing protein [Pseudomonas reinekei]KAB0483850.1 SidA/IucD/PvdA family monooxygenase [Pseudomonas reinekei]OLU00915.1 flavoprotein [Pseudomonas reinekei]SDO42886.1 Thioredoxin reductase [Pseudomonas reinekei]
MGSELPIAIIGAGPIGLAAACHLIAGGLTPLIFEAGPSAGASIENWAHVRMFSPWKFNIDKQSSTLLTAQGWVAPADDVYPAGRELLDEYIYPLAALPSLNRHLRLNTEVLAVTRLGQDVMKTKNRTNAPFLLRVRTPEGDKDVIASAVIDASGTFLSPNWMGAHGIPALGEKELAERIAYGIPEVLRSERQRYANRRVMVVGSGHSAFNVLQDLARLALQEPGTKILWVIRGSSLDRILGGGANDKLEERGKLGQRVRQLLNDGVIELFTNIAIDKVVATDDGIAIEAGGQELPVVDEVVVATGFRPKLELLSELRLALDSATQSPIHLAPLIDPNEHSCGTVRPHGAVELAHPDEGIFIVGMKSYGRAPTFLLLTGYEQVRSVAAALAGDWEAAKRVELVLPETGVCSTQLDDSDCCDRAADPDCCEPSCCAETAKAAEDAPTSTRSCCS